MRYEREAQRAPRVYARYGGAAVNRRRMPVIAPCASMMPRARMPMMPRQRLRFAADTLMFSNPRRRH